MDSRSKLLAAAAEEFARHGLQGARIQAIVSRAGVNERLIYHHFGSKDGLYRATLEDQVHGMGTEWTARLDAITGRSPREAMRASFRAYVEVFTSRPLLGPLLMQEARSGWQVRPKLTGETLPAQLRAIYERGRADGSFRTNVDFEVLYAVALSSLIAAPHMRGLLTDHPGGHGAVVDQVIELLLDGLTGDRTGEHGETKT